MGRGHLLLSVFLAILAGCTGDTRLEISQPPAPPPVTRPPDPLNPPDDDPPLATRRCAPGTAGIVWVLEQHDVSVQVRCTAEGAPASPEFAIDSLPPGATFDAATATLRWTPAGDQAALWRIAVRERLTGDEGRLRIGVIENEDAPGNVPIVDPAAYPEEYGLPVIHLFHPTPLEPDIYHPVTIVYRGQTHLAEAKIRGASSTEFPKVGFGLRFDDDRRFDEPAAGIYGRDRMVLVTTFNDNSYVRARLAFELWARISPDHLRVRNYSAVLYQNNRYVGLYTVVDPVDRPLLEDHGFSKVTDLFKAQSDDANFSRLARDDTPKVELWKGFEKKEGLPEDGAPGAYARIEELTAFVSDSSNAEFVAGFPQRFQARDYEDWWIFNTFIGGSDSHSKNAYHAWDPATGGPWRYIPWDLDASFGQNYDTTRSHPLAFNTYVTDNLLFERMLAQPSIAGPLRERYRQMLWNELALTEILAMLDALVAETAPSARRDWAKWETAHVTFKGDSTSGNFDDWAARTDFNSYEEEVEWIRTWLTARWEWLERDGIP